MISKYLERIGITQPDNLQNVMNSIDMMFTFKTNKQGQPFLTVEELLELKNVNQRSSKRQIPIFGEEKAALSLLENHASSSGECKTLSYFLVVCDITCSMCFFFSKE